ncbi:MAG: hypothetical protein AAGB19_20570 [Cyanobacteria bacterium P01_F01_bin.3]
MFFPGGDINKVVKTIGVEMAEDLGKASANSTANPPSNRTKPKLRTPAAEAQ